MHQPLRSRRRFNQKQQKSHKFDGSRGSKAEIFANQVGLYILINPAQLPDDWIKVVWTLSYMTGKGGQWAKPVTQRLLQNDPEDVLTWDCLVQHFEATFFDSDRTAKAKTTI